MTSEALMSLEVKRSLSEYFTTDRGRDYALAVAQVATDRLLGRAPMFLVHGAPLYDDNNGKIAVTPPKTDATQVSATMARRLDEAAPYWTSSDMCRLVAAATVSRTTASATVDSDAPSFFGFAYLSEPVLVEPYPNVRAILWYKSVGLRGKPGYDVIFFSDPRRTDDPVMAQTLKDNPRAMDGVRLFTVCHAEHIVFGEALEPDFYRDLVKTWWDLIGRPLASLEAIDADRYTRKRLEREGKPVPRITIIALRTRALKHDPEHVPAERNWTHRWLVDGFYREQWYPAEGVHKTIYINPYIKGPERLPLIIKQKVYAWRR